jgi:hypothetical protein
MKSFAIPAAGGFSRNVRKRDFAPKNAKWLIAASAGNIGVCGFGIRNARIAECRFPSKGGEMQNSATRLAANRPTEPEFLANLDP